MKTHSSKLIVNALLLLLLLLLLNQYDFKYFLHSLESQLKKLYQNEMK